LLDDDAGPPEGYFERSGESLRHVDLGCAFDA
jgi:hypothetical protein